MQNNNILLNILKKDTDFKTSIIISIIIGVCTYIYVSGYRIINPYYTEWIYHQWMDVAQNYTGWLAFLHSKWQFPLSLTDALTYPGNISIFWTDSNPLFSIIFKLLAPIYDYANIQFIGLFSLLSLTLSSIFASQIVRFFNKNLFVIILGTFFLIYKPTVLHRLIVHANLSSQFFIYACIAYILYNYKNDNVKKDLIICILLFVLAVSIHFYYVPIVLSFMFFYLLYKTIYFKKFRYISILLASALVIVLEMYMLGIFVNFETSREGGVGNYSFNLNGFWNPQYWSSLIKNKPIAYPGQSDGFAYLGLGFFFLLLICTPAILSNIKNIIQQKWNKSFKLIFLFTILYIVGIILIAMGGVVSYNDKVFAHIDLSFLLSTFKGHGRFIWILPIVFTVFLYIVILKKFSIKSIIIILFVASFIQIYDIDNKVSRIHKEYMADYEYNRIISKEDIAKLNEYGVKYAVLHHKHFIKYTSVIIPNGWKQSCAYTARPFNRLCGDNYNKALDNIRINNYSDDTIYVVHNTHIDLSKADVSRFYYKYDDQVVILPVQINSLEEINLDKFK